MKKNFLKIASLPLLAIACLFCVSLDARAASTTRLECAKGSIAVGDTTTCTVYMTADFTEEAPSGIRVTLNSSQYLKIGTVTANTTYFTIATNNSIAPTDSKFSTGLTLSLNKTTTPVTSGKEFELLSFPVTLAEEAKNIKDAKASCGTLCIGAVEIDGSPLTSIVQTTDYCYSPVIHKEDVPETGSFLNYALIIAGIGLAVVAIVIARRSSKFYKL